MFDAEDEEGGFCAWKRVGDVSRMKGVMVDCDTRRS